MAYNLLDSIKGIITPDLISSAASSLGENSGGISKALEGAVLAAAGTGKQVTDAEGYGSKFAKAAADAPESDRVHDRRVSVSVREK